jgi:hypothetical protein
MTAKGLLTVSMLLGLHALACAYQRASPLTGPSGATRPHVSALVAPVVESAPPRADVRERRLLPVDEASKDPSFLRFRTGLSRAVERRDAAFVIRALDPNITNSWGGDGGIAEFKNTWKPERPDSELWPTLGRVLGMGGSFAPDDPKAFWAPYVFSKFPEDLDAFDYAAVVSRSVTLRSNPSPGAAPVATLSYHLVKVHNDDPAFWHSERGEPEWYKVSTLGGLNGFLPSASVRFAIDYRAGFKKGAKGTWRMDHLVAGD